MRVIVVNDFAHVNGGAASVAVASACGLARRGHAVTFFSAVGPVESELRSSGIKVICTGQQEILADPNRLRAIRQGIWNREAGRAFDQVLSRLRRKDTIVHLHGWSKALSSSVVRVALDRGFKVVCTLHDYFTACPSGGFFDHSSVQHCHLRPLSLACVTRNCDPRNYFHKLWRVARQVAQERVGRLPGGIDAFIFLSRLSRDILRPYLPEAARMFQVSNPVDVPRQPPVEVERNSDFVMVGRLSPEKGGVVFARATRECGVPSVFVGDGPCRQEIALANPDASITGWVTRPCVNEFMTRARVLVAPSLCYETLGLVVLEAASRGVPAVVSDSCAATENVENGVTGLTFKRGDAHNLAAALRRLDDDVFVKRLGRAAYEGFWGNPPTLEQHIGQLEQVYDEVLGGRA